MNKLLTIGLGAAAVVVLLFVGIQLFGSADGGLNVGNDPTPTATPEPSPSAESSPSSDPADGGLPLGSPFVWSDGTGGAVPITVTIPAPGWGGETGWFALSTNEDSGPPDEIHVLAFNDSATWSVPRDACHMESTMPDTPSATVAELVAALSAQAPGDASAPVDIMLDGHAGKSITLQVPGDLAYTDGEFTDCDFGMYCLFVHPALEEVGPLTDACARPVQGPGQIEELYIVDVDGSIVVIDAVSWNETPAELVEEQRVIVDSITFGE